MEWIGWRTQWYVDANGDVPGIDFLIDLPHAVRVELTATLIAVQMAGSPTTFGNSEDRHRSMHGTCAGLHEARDRHRKMLYRLYLRWFPDLRRVVVLGGASKPNATKLPDSFYDELATAAARVDEEAASIATLEQVAASLWAATDRLQVSRDRRTKAGPKKRR